MLSIFKYLKNSIPEILLILVMLVIQASSDLSLPDYMSDIVDVGLNGKGIDESVPYKMTEDGYLEVVSMISAEDEKVLEEAYEKEEDVYILNKKYENMDELSDIMEGPMTLIGMADTMKEQMGDNQNQDDSKITEMLKQEQIDAMGILMNPMSSKEDKSEAVHNFLDNSDMKDVFVSAYVPVFIEDEYEEAGIDMDDYQNNYLVRTGVKMLGFACLGMLASIVVGYMASKVGAGIAMNLRNKVFRKVVGFSGEQMDKFSTASLITRNTNDIQQIQMVITMLLRMVLYAPVLCVGGIFKVVDTNLSMAWIIVVGALAIICVVLSLFFIAMPKFKIMQKLVDNVNLVAREILTGLPVIRVFSRDKHEQERFDDANVKLYKTQLFTNRVMTFMMPIMMFVMNGITLMVIWFGSKGIDKGDIQVGEMMAFMTYSIMIVMSFLMITMISIMLPRAGVAADRINEVLTTDYTIFEKDKPEKMEETGCLEYENVSFAYPDAENNVIENISFKAKPGETTAIIGSTGSGKSTLINLIPRLYDVSEGRILIGGKDIRDVSLKDLRAKLSIVPQKAVLFSGTIESNIKYGAPDLDEEGVKVAAKVAQASDFIEEKENGYRSPIAQGGTNVSGGQKQRLSIARAIAKNPQIYVFDDSFSALDYKTDKKLRSELKKYTKDSVVIIVAQRISTILDADQILVLDEGKIVGKGRHKELLENCEVYRQIAQSQLSAKEIEDTINSVTNKDTLDTVRKNESGRKEEE